MERKQLEPAAPRSGLSECAAAGDRLADIQQTDLPSLIAFFGAFWESYASDAVHGRVTPLDKSRILDALLGNPLPEGPMDAEQLLDQVRSMLAQETVKTRHPMFLGYVTPPALEIAALGEALAAVVNQNVAFATLSPLGTALEATVVRWLGEIVGYPQTCGGILTSGGSNANLYGLAAARYQLFGFRGAVDGNYADSRRLRIYCSEQTHHSVDKAAILLGLGTDGIRRIPVDRDHRVRVDLLRTAIEQDIETDVALPMVIVGNAGTRLCCAYDDLTSLREIADEYRLWLHVDAAYGGFLRIAEKPPCGAEAVYLADSVVLDPHKLLFVPFDCGSLLVRHPRHLSDCFGAEGEYNEMRPSGPLHDYANFGMQLGRSMKALKVWLALKRYGRATYSAEFTRLLRIAAHLTRRVDTDPRFERMGPAGGTAICFRWCESRCLREDELDRLNSIIRRTLVRRGAAFVDEVVLDGKTGFRLCMTNFNTDSGDVDRLLEGIASLASSLSRSGDWNREPT